MAFTRYVKHKKSKAEIDKPYISACLCPLVGGFFVLTDPG